MSLSAFVLSFAASFGLDSVIVCQDEEHSLSQTAQDLQAAGSLMVSGVSHTEILAFLQQASHNSKSTLIFCPGAGWQDQFVEHSKFGSGNVFLFNSIFVTDLDASNKLQLDSLVFLFSDVKDTILVQEVYRIKKGPLIAQSFGNWTADTGLSLTEPNIWERRKDLKGVEILNSLLPWRPFTYENEDGKQLGRLTLHNFFII